MYNIQFKINPKMNTFRTRWVVLMKGYFRSSARAVVLHLRKRLGTTGLLQPTFLCDSRRECRHLEQEHFCLQMWTDNIYDWGLNVWNPTSTNSILLMFYVFQANLWNLVQYTNRVAFKQDIYPKLRSASHTVRLSVPFPAYTLPSDVIHLPLG